MNKAILVWVIMGTLTLNSEASERLITHNSSTDSSVDLSKIKENLEQKKETTLPLDDEFKLLEQLSQFELGRFLLVNKGLNGYWTSYIILHGHKKQNLAPLEEWLLNRAPSVKATQERFRIFQKALQGRLKDNVKIASVPCGIMDDLLTLDYTGIKEPYLTGIDLDHRSLELAQENAKKHNLTHIEFIQRDAWNLDLRGEYDLITSNGLNIYEPDDIKVIKLYKQFHVALKADGILITSFLTPPPTLSKESTWKNVNLEDSLKQKAIFGDIIGATWQTFRTEDKTREQLEQAGFQVLEVIYDSQGIFPTIIAKKKDITVF